MGRLTMFTTLLSCFVVFHIVSAGPLGQQGNALVQQDEDPTQLDNVLALVLDDAVAAGLGHQNISVRSGCPDISELPIVRNKQFLGFRSYRGKGNDIPALSCTGNYYDYVNGFQYSEWTGPLFISNVPTSEFGHICGDGVACVRSFLVDCKQQYPDCQPEDSWKTVASFDN